MATEKELLAITQALTKSLNKVMDKHQSFLSELYGEKAGARKTPPKDSPTSGTTKDKDKDKPVKKVKGGSPTAGMEANRRLTQSVSSLDTHITNISKQFGDLSKNLQGSTNEMLLAAQVQAKIRKDILDDAEKQSQLSKESKEAIEDNNEAIKDSAEELKSFSEGMKDTVTGWMSNFSAMKGATQALDELQTAASRGGVYNLQTQIDSVLMGMNAKDLIDLQSTYRTDVLRNSNGLQGWTESLKNSQLDLIGFTGSLAEANKVSAQMRSTFMTVGTSFEDVTDIMGSGSGGLIGEMKKLSVTTGKTVSELNQINAGLVSSDDARRLLSKMTKDQRLSYLTSQGQTLRQYTMLTGSVERANDIIRTQQADSRMTFKDRFVQAQKMQVVADRLGMSPEESRRIAELKRMNPAQLAGSPDLLLEQKKLFGELSRRLVLLQGSDQYYEENAGNIYARQVGDSLDAFNTALDNPISNEQASRAMDDSISKQIEGNELLTGALATQGRIESLLKNSLTQIAGGAIAGIGALLASSRPGFGGKIIDRLKGVPINVPGGSGLSGPDSNTPTKPGKGLSRGASFGLAAVSGLAAGIVLDLYDPKTQTQESAKNAAGDAITGASMGAMIGSVIAPGIGTAIGAGLGGIVGSIYGLTKATTSQQAYDAKDAAKASQDHVDAFNDKKLSEIMLHDIKIKDLKDLKTLATDSDKDLIDAKIKQELEYHNTRMEGLSLEQASSANLASAMKMQSTNEKKISDRAAMADRGFGTTRGSGYGNRSTVETVDAAKIQELSGMGVTDFMADFKHTLLKSRKEEIPQRVTDLIRHTIEGGGLYDQNPEIVALMHEYINASQVGLQSQRFTIDSNIAAISKKVIASTRHAGGTRAQLSHNPVAEGIDSYMFEPKSVAALAPDTQGRILGPVAANETNPQTNGSSNSGTQSSHAATESTTFNLDATKMLAELVQVSKATLAVQTNTARTTEATRIAQINDLGSPTNSWMSNDTFRDGAGTLS